MKDIHMEEAAARMASKIMHLKLLCYPGQDGLHSLSTSQACS